MGWICDYCSSNNDDGTVECFVCGRSRSVESIRKEKERLRKEKSDKHYKRIHSRMKVIFATAIAVSSIVVVIGIIQIITNSRYDDIRLVVDYLLKRFSHNADIAFTTGILPVVNRFSMSPWKELSTCFSTIVKHFSTSLVNVSIISPCLLTHVIAQLTTCYECYIQAMGNIAGKNLGTVGNIAVAEWGKIQISFERCIRLIDGCKNKILSHF